MDPKVGKMLLEVLSFLPFWNTKLPQGVRLQCDLNDLTTLVAMIGVLRNLYWVNLEEIDQMNESKLSYGTKDGDMLSLLELYNDFQDNNGKKDNNKVKEWAKRNYVSSCFVLSEVLISYRWVQGHSRKQQPNAAIWKVGWRKYTQVWTFKLPQQPLTQSIEWQTCAKW